MLCGITASIKWSDSWKGRGSFHPLFDKLLCSISLWPSSFSLQTSELNNYVSNCVHQNWNEALRELTKIKTKTTGDGHRSVSEMGVGVVLFFIGLNVFFKKRTKQEVSLSEHKYYILCCMKLFCFTCFFPSFFVTKHLATAYYRCTPLYNNV